MNNGTNINQWRNGIPPVLNANSYTEKSEKIKWRTSQMHRCITKFVKIHQANKTICLGEITEHTNENTAEKSSKDECMCDIILRYHTK